MASRRMAALASYQLTPVCNRYTSSRKKARKQMTQNGDGFAHLRPLHPTALLQPSMIDFNPPSLFRQLLSLLLRHLQVMGRPVFRVPVLGRNTRTSPKPFRCTTRPSGGISTSRIPLPIRIHQTVALQPGQEKPAEGGDELKKREFGFICAFCQSALRSLTPKHKSAEIFA
jgi:hypothetical protein